MSNKRVLEVLDVVFDSFFDNESNTKHLDHEFLKQIVEVEHKLKLQFEKEMSNEKREQKNKTIQGIL